MKPAPQSVNGVANTPTHEFINSLKFPFSALAMGLCHQNGNVAPPLMLAGLATAMGAVMSEASASPDIAMTLRFRADVLDAFSRALKSHVPSLSMGAPTSAIPN